MKIEANGISINYEVHGRGTALILIHGFGGNLTYWEPQVAAFSRKFRVIAYDRRGCGESGQPQSGFGYNDFVEDLHQLMLKLKVGRAYLLGFSQGGAIALLTATRYPEMVKALILSNSSVDFTTPFTDEERKQAAGMIALIEKEGVEKYARMFIKSNFSPGLEQRAPAVWDSYYQMLLRSRPETLIGVVKSGLEQRPPELELTKVKCPVLFIQGEHDLLVTPERRERAVKSIAGSRMVVLPVGHATAAEAPDEFNRAVIEFLTECETE